MRTCASPHAGPISCTASEDGILAQGTASVSLAATSLSIAGGEHGVHASGNAEVVLAAPTCRITGDEGPERIDGNATIDSCATQVVVPPDGRLSPLRCTEGTVSLPAQQPAQLPTEVSLEIQGGGEDCLRAEGQCTIDLDLGGRNLTLTGCERCIQAGGNADVRLTNAGLISCTASEDGILAQGTASVSLAATSLSIAGGSTACTRMGEPVISKAYRKSSMYLGCGFLSMRVQEIFSNRLVNRVITLISCIYQLSKSGLTIAGEEHGVHAAGTAEVVLTVPVPACTITGTEGLWIVTREARCVLGIGGRLRPSALSWSSRCHLRQGCLRLRQPQGPGHRTGQFNGGRERRAGLLPPAHRNIQHADTAVAVRLEGAHPQGYGKSERLLITGVDCCPCRGF